MRDEVFLELIPVMELLPTDGTRVLRVAALVYVHPVLVQHWFRLVLLTALVTDKLVVVLGMFSAMSLQSFRRPVRRPAVVTMVPLPAIWVLGTRVQLVSGPRTGHREDGVTVATRVLGLGEVGLPDRDHPVPVYQFAVFGDVVSEFVGHFRRIQSAVFQLQMTSHVTYAELRLAAVVTRQRARALRRVPLDDVRLEPAQRVELFVAFGVGHSQQVVVLLRTDDVESSQVDQQKPSLLRHVTTDDASLFAGA